MALLNNTEVTGIEEKENELIAYWDEDQFDQEAVYQIADNYGIKLERHLLPTRNWNAEWEKNFPPVIIDGFCSVRAAFHTAPENILFDIVITPKMSFGTGHHATTASMIGMMKKLSFVNANVLDFGTGTGVLAILAEKMGAPRVIAIDNDEWSYNNALENCENNKTQHIIVRQATADDLDDTPQFDIILANINRHILLAYMQKMYILANENATLLLSGILVEDIAIIKQSATENGFVYMEEMINNNWICMRFTKL